MPELNSPKPVADLHTNGANPAVPKIDRSGPAPLRGIKIVVIDDYETLGRGMVRMCNSLGAESTFLFHKGEPAADSARKIVELDPQVVIIDGQLSCGVSGLDVLRQLKADAPNLMCIGATANHGLLAPFIDAGAARVISKPFGKDELLAALEPAPS